MLQWELEYQVLTDWFTRKNVDDTVIFVTIFITGTNHKFVRLLIIFPLDGNHSYIYIG